MDGVSISRPDLGGLISVAFLVGMVLVAAAFILAAATVALGLFQIENRRRTLDNTWSSSRVAVLVDFPTRRLLFYQAEL